MRDRIESFNKKWRWTPGCWIWTGAKTVDGDGKFLVASAGGKYKYRLVQAHRFAYEMWVGGIPAGVNISRRCGNRCCVNPDHLIATRSSINPGDMLPGVRHPCLSGELHTKSKLTEAQARRIKYGGEPIPPLAKEFGITKSHAYGIRRGIFWRHI